MKQIQKENLQRLLADNARSLRWLEPVFDTPEQRAWLNQYRDYLQSTYNDTTFEGVGEAAQRTPMALAQIYVKEYFTQQNLSNREGQQDIEETLQQTASDELEDLLLKFDEKDQPIGVGGGSVLMGAPGSGKSTLVRLLAVACSTRNQRLSHAASLGRRMVIPFILREMDLSEVTTTQQLLELWAVRVKKISDDKYSVDIKHAQEYLEQGWAIAAFDGIDEISQRARKRLQRLIYAFRARYPKIAVLVTGRPVGFTRLPFTAPKPRLWQAIAIREGWQQLPPIPNELPKRYLRPFANGQVNEYVQRWYAARYPKNKAKQQQESALLVNNLAHSKALNALKRRPIYLANLTYVHDVKGRLPNSHARAYNDMIEAYLSTLDDVKRFHDRQRPEEAGPDFAVEDKWQALEWLAHDLHCSEVGEKDEESEQPFNLRISKIDFEQWLSEKLPSLRTSISEDQIPSLTRYFTARAGLLVEPEEGVLSFSHLSFQEFLAASWIYRQMGNHQFELQKFLRPELLNRIESSDWHPVGLSFFGLHTLKQGGSFQEQLLTKEWLDETQADLKQHERRFAFLIHLISEGESSLSLDMRKRVWYRYWELAQQSDEIDWGQHFFQAAQSWNLWGEPLHNELAKDFQTMEILTDQGQEQLLLLYANLPTVWLTKQWTKKAKDAGGGWKINSLSPKRKIFLDLHALFPEVYELLRPHYSLEEQLLLGQTGYNLFTLQYLQRDQSARDIYQQWLASEALAIKQDVNLNRTLARVRVLNLDRAFTRTRTRARALALNRAFTLTLDRTLDRALGLDLALNRAFTLTRAGLRLDLDLDLDLALTLTLDRTLDRTLLNEINVWNLSVATARLTPCYFLTPQAASHALEQLAINNAELKKLFETDWFPYKTLKRMCAQPFIVEPIEADTQRIYASLLRQLKKAGKSTDKLPPHLSLAPGEAMRKWHGDKVADQYLKDLKAAGWDAEKEPWPPG